jgi:pyruvate dehydrogenase E1 component beta subunit
MLYMSGGQWGCPIVFRGNDGAGGQLGSTHSWCVEGLYANVPGLKMAIPSNPYDAKGLLKTAIRDPDPVFFLESERMLGDKAHVPEEEYYIPFGEAAIAARATTARSSRGAARCTSAWTPPRARRGGHRLRRLDMRTIRPLDIDTDRRERQKTNRCVVVDQSWPFGSIASEVAAQVHQHCFDELDNHVHRVNADDVPAPYAFNLEQEMLPNARKICEAVRAATYNA